MYNSILNTYQLSEEQILGVYPFHQHIYLNREMGFSFMDWRKELKKSYHNTSQKLIQLVKDESDKIIGYTIFTKPIKVQGAYWSKILEGGIISKNSQIDFLNMINQLTDNYFKYPVNFIGETSIKSRLVLKLMKQSDFVINEDIDVIELVFSTLLNSNKFYIYKDEGLIIQRETGLTKNYIGNVIVKKAPVDYANLIYEEEVLIESNC